MNVTWATTFKGKKFHSFTTDGRALCRDNIRTLNSRKPESSVDAMLAEAFGAHGYSKCNTCAAKEATFRNRLEASMAPVTGEGDYLPPVAPVAETPAAPAAPVGSVDAELRLLRRVVRETRKLAELVTLPDGLTEAVAEYDSHMSGRKAQNDRSWVLSPDNINRVDDVLDAEGIYAKGYWTFNGTATVCTGLKIGPDPMLVARYGDTVTVSHDGTWGITPAK